MPEPFLFTLASVLAVSVISLIGIFMLYANSHRLRTLLFVLISFAVGSMLGDVFFHIIPELYTEQNPSYISLYLLGGIILFFILEHFLHWRHSCKHELEPCEEGQHIHPVAYINVISDGFHNLLDGAMIGAAYLVDVPLGIATTIAVLLHEIPQELGDFGILIHAGLSKTKALVFNLLSALWAVVGGVVAFLIGSAFESYVPVMLALTAGGFLYIAGSDLMPELHKEIQTRRSVAQFVAIIGGIAIMYALTFLE